MSGTRLHTGTFTLAKGIRLNGIYEIDSLLTSGGMGDIYKGHSIETGDTVAIKVMRHELAENAAALALFRKEASALHHLYHEAIVRYFVFTVEPELQRPYLAMEFVDGEPLSTILKNEPLSFEAVWDLKNRLAQGLQAAHELGIIHRDVSPDNVLVPSRDVRKAKIIDFGIARSTRLDSAGTVIGNGFAGKYSYVSPEQLGMFGGEVTAKSDIYSLGLVLAEACTGQPIDMGMNHFESIERRRVVPDLQAVDARLRPLLEKMLAPEPHRRPTSMVEVALANPIQPEVVYSQGDFARATHQKASPGERTPAFHKKASVRISLATGGLAILGAAAAAVYLLLAFPETNIRPQPPPSPSGNSTSNENRLPDDNARPKSTSSTQEQWAAFINKYDGGECFFLLPTTLQLAKPKIDGYGASIEPFETFDNAFAKANKIEPDIGVHQVTPAQCPAITFLNQMRSNIASALKLELSALKLRAGDTLTGTLQNVGSRYPTILMVSETGSVHNLTNFVRPEGETRRFTIPLPKAGTPGEQPQLLVALATSQPLEDLHVTGPLNAASLFPQLRSAVEQKRDEVGITAQYFKVER